MAQGHCVNLPSRQSPSVETSSSPGSCLCCPRQFFNNSSNLPPRRWQSMSGWVGSERRRGHSPSLEREGTQAEDLRLAAFCSSVVAEEGSTKRSGATKSRDFLWCRDKFVEDSNGPTWPGDREGLRRREHRVSNVVREKLRVIRDAVRQHKRFATTLSCPLRGPFHKHIIILL